MFENRVGDSLYDEQVYPELDGERIYHYLHQSLFRLRQHKLQLFFKREFLHNLFISL